MTDEDKLRFKLALAKDMQKVELRGVIRKWVPNKNFGFIETKDGDYYFKEQDIVSGSSKSIKVKNKVTFEAFISPSNDECDSNICPEAKSVVLV